MRINIEIMPFSGWHFGGAGDYGDFVIWIGRFWLVINWKDAP